MNEFPFTKCQSCKYLGILDKRDREEEFDQKHPEICNFWDCDSLRPSICPLESEKGKEEIKGKVNQVTFSVNLCTHEVKSNTEEGKDAGLLFLSLLGKARKARGE